MSSFDEPIRIDDGRHYSHITFEMRKGSSSAHLIAISHISLRSFFKVVQRFSEQRSGLVLLEGTQHLPLTGGSPAEETIALLRNDSQLYVQLLCACGYDFAYQSDALDYDCIRYESADQSIEDDARTIEQELGTHFFARRKSDYLQALEILSDAPEDYRHRSGVDLLRSLAQTTDVFSCERLPDDDRREQVLVECIAKQSQKEGHLVIPWGAAHIKPITECLFDDGWQVDPGTIEYVPYTLSV